MSKLTKNEDAFTGLEAAIVLIAFVVVAAVFSYVVLGAGFFTTQKSQEVVHSSVGQASSSVEVIGDVYGHGSTASQKIHTLEFTLGLTAGGSVVDMDSTVLTYSSATEYYVLEKKSEVLSNSQWNITGIKNGGAEGGEVLQPGEQFVINAKFKTPIGPNDHFTLEVKPATGATLGISRTAPPQIDPINKLY